MDQRNGFFKNSYVKKAFGFIALTAIAFFFMTLFTMNSDKEIDEFVWDNLQIALFIGFLLMFINPVVFKMADRWIFKRPLDHKDQH